MFLKFYSSVLKRWGLFIVAIFLMTGIECCYFLNDASILKRFAAFLWIGLAVGIFFIAGIYALAPFFQSSFWKKPGKWWYLIAFFFPLFLIYLGVGGIEWTPVNLEGIHQSTVGVGLLKHDPDLGIYKVGYYDRYVARQYALASLPTYVFGPSLMALRIGNSFIYTISYLAFLAAFAAYLESQKKNALLWASWAGMMISLGQYTLIQARMFEQTTMPIGATLMFIAAVLCFLLKPTALRAAWLAWSVSFLTCGYTPAYGSWVFAIGVLFYLAFHPQYKHRILLFAVAQGVVSFWVAYLILHGQGHIEGNILKLGPGILTWYDWLWRYFSGFIAEFNAGYSVIPVPLGIAAFIVLFLSFKKRDGRVFLTFLWCCSIVLVSLTLLGSYFNPPHYDVHRSIIIIPVMAVGVVIFYTKYYSKNPRNNFIETIARCSMIYMIYTSFSFPLLNRWYYLYDNIADFDEAALHLSEVTNTRGLPPIQKLYIQNPLNITRETLEMILRYFAPDAVLSYDLIPQAAAGNYVMSYNDNPREYDTKIPSKDLRPYITLEQAPDPQIVERLLQKIDANNGLVVDYQFAEGAGKTAADSAGNFNPAILTGKIDWSGDKKGLDLDGVDGFVTLPSMNIEPKEMTIAIWVKWNGGGDWQRILDFGNLDDTYIFLAPVPYCKSLRLSMETLFPIADQKSMDVPPLPVGVWTHLAITLTEEKVTLYMNGEPANEMTIKLMPTAILKCRRNWFGKSRCADDPYFNGSIGRFQIYNRVLSQPEIQEMAAKQIP